MGDVVELSKSPSDKKQYRLLTLPNALQVLLISMVDVPHSGTADDDEDENEDGSDGDDEEDDDDDLSSDNGSEQSGFDGEHGAPRRRAGACLTVGVGSFAEPEQLPGLAHYLEHMLFMGT
jgi:nardilysin